MGGMMGGGGGAGAGMNYGAMGAAALGSFNKELGNQFQLLGALTGGERQIEYIPPTMAEKLMRLRTGDLLREGRDVAESGASLQGELLGPLLAQLGYQFDTVSNVPQLKAEQAKLDKIRADMAGLRQQLNQKKAKAPGQRAGAGLKKQLKALRQEQTLSERELGRLRADPTSIANIRPAGPTPQELASNQIQDRLSQRVLQALDGEIPDDPRLIRELERQENLLRERLSRQLGNGYDLTSPGQEALANFAQRKAEAFAEAQRTNLNQGFNQMLQGRGQLENIARARRGEVESLAAQRMSTGDFLAGLGMSNVRAQQPYQYDRDMKFKVSAARMGQPTGSAATFGALSTYADQKGENMYRLAAALGAGGQGGGGGGGAAQPETIQVPQY